jgi:hypothetical protein
MADREKRIGRLRRGSLLESLESRRLMAAQPDFANFASTAGLVGNGFGGKAITSGDALQLTDSQAHEARTIWFDKRVDVDSFTTSFSFNVSDNASSADGFTFTLQSRNTEELGTDGYHFGYTGIERSVAVTFNFWNDGLFGSQSGFVTDGHVPITANDITPVDLHNGDVYDATITYNGTTLTMTVTDADVPSDTFSQSEQINIPATVDSDTAYAGFTGATGHDVSTQDIDSWSYSGSAVAPTVAEAASAAPNPTTTPSTDLSALALDPATDDTVDYTWSALTLPKGGKVPNFGSTNGTPAGSSLTAKFSKAGTYVLRCTMTNAAGKSVVSDVLFVAQQTATSVRLTPHKNVVTLDQQTQYRGVLLDQFGNPMAQQPAFSYSASGVGSIDADSGDFSALDIPGHFVVSASADGLDGVVGGTVVVG